MFKKFAKVLNEEDVLNTNGPKSAFEGAINECNF